MDVAVARRQDRLLGGMFPIGAVAACLALMFAGSTLPTPLYAIYQREFGFSELTLTLVYAAYVVGNLFSLLFAGGLSDQVGRRPVVYLAIALGAASTLIYLFARGTPWLAAGRLVSGLALGIASGTCTAWLADLHTASEKPRATAIAVGANMTGLALGALLAGLLAQFAPWPLGLSFVIYLAALLLLTALVAVSPETIRGRVSAFQHLSLAPRLGVPRGIRADFFAPAVTVFGSMALFGFYAALAPTILSRDLRRDSHATSGALVCELCLVATLTVFATRALRSRTAMLSGLALMLPSVGLIVWAQDAKSLTLLLLGTTSAGLAAALGYRGSLQVINRIAPVKRRAEVVSSYLLAGFVGNSIPIIGVGLASEAIGPLPASLLFAATIALFAVAALFIGWRHAPREG